MNLSVHDFDAVGEARWQGCGLRAFNSVTANAQGPCRPVQGSPYMSAVPAGFAQWPASRLPSAHRTISPKARGPLLQAIGRPSEICARHLEKIRRGVAHVAGGGPEQT